MEKEINNDIVFPKVKYPFWGVLFVFAMLILFVFVFSNINLSNFVKPDSKLVNQTLMDYIINNIITLN